MIYGMFLFRNECVQACATRNKGSPVNVTCSDDTDISPQDLPTVQHNFFQLWGKNTGCWRLVLRGQIGGSLSF